MRRYYPLLGAKAEEKEGERIGGEYGLREGYGRVCARSGTHQSGKLINGRSLYLYIAGYARPRNVMPRRRREWRPR
jgi:hypothetical protein